MITWLSNLFSKKEKENDPMELDCFKFGHYAIKIRKLKFDLRLAKGYGRQMKERLDHAHEIMSHERVGMYEYLETPETRLQERMDRATFSIQHKGYVSTIRIYKAAGLPVPEKLITELEKLENHWDEILHWKPRETPTPNRRNYKREQNRKFTNI